MTLIQEAGVAGCIPAGCMAVGSLLILAFRQINLKFQAVMQNFSAGIILAAVALELFPRLEDDSLSHGKLITALCIGFVAGLVVLFGLKQLTEGGEEDEPASKQEGGPSYQSDDIEFDGLLNSQIAPLQDTLNRLVALVDSMCQALVKGENQKGTIVKQMQDLRVMAISGRGLIRNAQSSLSPSAIDELSAQLLSVKETTNDVLTLLSSSEVHGKEIDGRLSRLEQLVRDLDTIPDDWRPQKFRRWSAPPAPPAHAVLSEKIPYGLVFAVMLDAFVDGFLIGLAYIASTHAGLIMAGATCIEMGFLGLTYSATLKGITRSRCKHVSLVLSPPVLLVLGALAGAWLGDVAKESAAVFVGFIAFSVVALLFLVTQELLIEAHENQDGAELWWVNVWLFVGILVVMVVENLTKE